MWHTRHARPRRRQTRIPIETLCSEIASEREQHALVVDLTEQGLRLQRPLAGRLPSRIVQIEFEIPGYDDLIWASGVICFDQLWRQGPVVAERPRFVRTSGIKLTAAAGRHLRVLREYVAETRRAIEASGTLAERRGGSEEVAQRLGGTDWLMRASAFAIG